MPESEQPAAVRDTSPGIEELYAETFDLLLGTAMSSFGIPREDAAALVHDIFVSLISRMDEVRDHRTWLVGAICNASRGYLRRKASDDYRKMELVRTAEAGEMKDDLVVVRQALARIDDRSREILGLRYLQGYTVDELAGHLQTTPRYTEKLLRKALLRAWEVSGGIDEQTARRA